MLTHSESSDNLFCLAYSHLSNLYAVESLSSLAPSWSHLYSCARRISHCWGQVLRSRAILTVGCSLLKFYSFVILKISLFGLCWIAFGLHFESSRLILFTHLVNLPFCPSSPKIWNEVGGINGNNTCKFLGQLELFHI